MLLYVALLLFNMTIFFSDLLPYNTVLKFLVMVLLIADLFLFHKATLKFHKKYIPYIVFTVYLWINILVGGDVDFVVTFSINTLILLILLSLPHFIKIEIYMIGVMSGIHLIASLMVQVLPSEVINNMFSHLFIAGYNVNYSWRMVSGVNVGMTKQPGVNAMYLVSFFAFCFAKIYAKSRLQILYFIGMILSLTFIFLTGKRSASIFVPLCVIIFFLLFKKRKFTKKGLVKIFVMCIGTIFLLGFLNNQMSIFSFLIEKMSSLNGIGDVSNGRLSLWNDAIEQFWTSPILGVGVKAIYNSTGYDAHNTYIQILAETGIIGMLLFVLAIVALLKNIFSTSKKVFMDQNETINVSLCYGIYILIFLLIYGMVGNTFIDYLPLSLFVLSIALIGDCIQNTNNGIELQEKDWWK